LGQRARTGGLVVGLALVGLVAVGGSPRGLARAEPEVGPVPAGDFLVSTTDGRLVILTRAGRLVRRVPGSVARYGSQGIALAPDRRHAFVAIPRGERPLYRVDLSTGSRRWVANAVSPSVSPDGTRLAFLRVGSRQGSSDVFRVTALVIRSLVGGPSRSILLGPPPPLGTPPELVISWSTDDKLVALFD